MNRKYGILFGAIAITLLMVSTPLIPALGTTPETTTATTGSDQKPDIVNPSDISIAEVLNYLQIIKARSNDPEVQYECQKAISHLSGGIIRTSICEELWALIPNFFVHGGFWLWNAIKLDIRDLGYISQETMIGLIEFGLVEVGLLMAWFLLHCKSISGSFFSPLSVLSVDTATCSICDTSSN